MSSDDDRWIERTGADPEFADAVWSGAAPADGAPSWYPRFAELIAAAGDSRPERAAASARAREAWAELERNAARHRRRRRRMLAAGAVALGAALAAGGAAAATGGGFSDVPFLGSEANTDADGPSHVTVLDPAPPPSTNPPVGDGPGTTRPPVVPGGGRTPRRSCQPDVSPAPGCSERGRRPEGRDGGGPPPHSSAAEARDGADAPPARGRR